jgi:uncharacterized membrane protein
MLHISNALLVLLLWVNLTGLALAVRKAAGSWAIARAGSPVALVAALFFVEHYLGLGRLYWLLPFSTAASIWLLARHRSFLRARWRVELIFLGSFLYVLAWRYTFPDMDASSERITDLSFIVDYSGGGRLPPVDRWLPPFSFEIYYALQHYGAALIGRILDTPPGTAYNLGFCTLVALATTAGGAAAMLFIGRTLPALLVTASVLIGGVGTAPLIRLVEKSPSLYASARFIGASFAADSAKPPFGTWLLQASHVNGQTPDLPVETLSYMVGLGDYHPPLSGYLLLMLAMLAIAHLEKGKASEAAHVLLGACAPLTLASNTWQFPLQLALLAGYVSLRVYAKKAVAWKYLAGGFLGVLLLLEPFLAHFGPVSVDARMPIKLVTAAQRTPAVLWLLLFYPLVTVLALQIFRGKKTRLTVGLCLLWIALLIFSELFFVDDLYGGKYERFNTVLKWWAWIYSGGMLLFGSLNLRADSRTCRWGTALMLGLACCFGLELGAHYWMSPKPHFGQLDGAGLVRDDAGERVILDVLRHAPPSIVLQRIPTGAYTIQPALTMLAGQTAFLGWPNHENVWRSSRSDIDARQRDVQAFYSGELQNSSRWLEGNGIRFVIWQRDDNQLPAGTWDKVSSAIKDRYLWHGYYEVGNYHVGLWERESSR